MDRPDEAFWKGMAWVLTICGPFYALILWLVFR